MEVRRGDIMCKKGNVQKLQEKYAQKKNNFFMVVCWVWLSVIMGFARNIWKNAKKISISFVAYLFKLHTFCIFKKLVKLK